MNAKRHKVIFSKKKQCLIVVAENRTSSGKGQGTLSSLLETTVQLVCFSASTLALLVSSAIATPVTQLPDNGSVVVGEATISQIDAKMDIIQFTDKAAINWKSFNIGQDASLHVNQPDSSSVLLNRDVGLSPSEIAGKITANGHVIVINPNGILMSNSGSVNTGGFTASTLSLSDQDFRDGKYNYIKNGNGGW